MGDLLERFEAPDLYRVVRTRPRVQSAVPLCRRALRATVTAHVRAGAGNGLPWAGQSEEGLMPEVVFYALAGRSVEQKRALIKDFTDAVVKNYKVDPSAVTITIVESSKEDKAKGGVLFSDMGAPKS